jgi:type IV pilus assembly protein PilM
MLPVPVAQTLLDFYPVSEGQGEQGPVIHGLLIAALKDAVAANVAAVRRAGLNPVRVDIIPFALSRLNFRERNARGTFAAIDVGATTTNIVISTAGVPQFVRMIPVGGDETTSALANTLSIGRGQAESLKRARGLTPPNNFDGADPRVADAIRTSVNELLVALKNTILYYLNSRPGEMIQGIVLSGGGSSMSGFAAAVGEATKIPVTIADPFSTVDLSRGLRNRGVANSAEYSVALGLALGGTE